MEQVIRTSQSIHTYGPGAIADFPELSVLVLAHDIPQDKIISNGEYWGESEDGENRIIDERLSSAFSIDCFVTAPTSESVNNAKIQTVRFPSMTQCPITGELFDVRKLERVEESYTDRTSRARKSVDETFTGYDSPNNKYRKLMPVRWVIATEDGYLDDFPFDWYIHTRLGLTSEIGKGNRLFLTSSGNSASLKNVKLESKHRDTGVSLGYVTLEKIFDQEDTFVNIENSQLDYMQYVKNYLPKPWFGRVDKVSSNGVKGFKEYPVDDLPYPPYSNDASDEEKRKQLSKYPRTLLRGAGNLYFPIIYKGISLPKSGYTTPLPEDLIYRFKKSIHHWSDILKGEGVDIDDVDSILEFLRKNDDGYLKVIIDNLSYSVDEADSIIRQFFEQNSNVENTQFTIEELRKQEFDCFLNDSVETKMNDWYSSRIILGEKYQIGVENLIEKVVLLDKIKELKIFRGFTRIKPLMFEDLIFESPDKVTGRRKVEFARIQDPRSDSRTNTLPCTEVKGEGIFIKFNDEILKQWESKPEVLARFSIIQNNNNRYRLSFGLSEDEILSPRYVLLHTLSHILINELAIECGYGSSSLSEIIYAGNNNNSNMNGILIYTSTSDSEGTLGGLVEKGEPTFLSHVFEKALGKAAWCGSDPLCLETNSGKGFMAVNLGACHSCCLLPETSCCNMNKFLDRAMLIGTLSDPSIGLFS